MTDPNENKRKQDDQPDERDLGATISREEADALEEFDGVADIPTSLNEELEDKIKDNPNKFIGCGG